MSKLQLACGVALPSGQAKHLFYVNGRIEFSAILNNAINLVLILSAFVQHFSRHRLVYFIFNGDEIHD